MASFDEMWAAAAPVAPASGSAPASSMPSFDEMWEAAAPAAPAPNTSSFYRLWAAAAPAPDAEPSPSPAMAPITPLPIPKKNLERGGELALNLTAPTGLPVWRDLGERQIAEREVALGRRLTPEERQAIMDPLMRRAGAIVTEKPDFVDQIGAGAANTLLRLRGRFSDEAGSEYWDRQLRNLNEFAERDKSFGAFATRAAAQTVPYLAVSIVGTPYAAGAMGAAAGSEEMRVAARDLGVDPWSARGVAAQTGGAGVGLVTEALGAKLGMGGSSRVLTTKMAESILRPTVGNVVKQGGRALGTTAISNAVEEGIEQIGQNAIERHILGNEQRGYLDAVPEAAAAGAIGGTVFAPINVANRVSRAQRSIAETQGIQQELGNKTARIVDRPKSNADYIVADEIAKVSGRPAIWYEAEGDDRAGFFKDGQIYLNAGNSDEAIKAKAAHEVVHALWRDPETSTRLMQAVKANPQLVDAASREYVMQALDAGRPDVALRVEGSDYNAADEGMAVLAEYTAKHPEFLKNIGLADRTLGQYISNAARGILDAIKLKSPARAALARKRAKFLTELDAGMSGVRGEDTGMALEDEMIRRRTVAPEPQAEQESTPSTRLTLDQLNVRTSQALRPATPVSDQVQLRQAVDVPDADQQYAEKELRRWIKRREREQSIFEQREAAKAIETRLAQLQHADQQAAREADAEIDAREMPTRERVAERPAPEPLREYTEEQLRAMPRAKMRRHAARLGLDPSQSPSILLPQIAYAQAKARYERLTNRELFRAVKDRGMSYQNRQQAIDLLIRWEMNRGNVQDVSKQPVSVQETKPEAPAPAQAVEVKAEGKDGGKEQAPAQSESKPAVVPSEQPNFLDILDAIEERPQAKRTPSALAKEFGEERVKAVVDAGLAVGGAGWNSPLNVTQEGRKQFGPRPHDYPVAYRNRREVVVAYEDITGKTFKPTYARGKEISVGGKYLVQVEIPIHKWNRESAGRILYRSIDEAKQHGKQSSPVAKQTKPNAAVVPAGEKATPQPASGKVDTIAGRMDLEEFEKKGYQPEEVTRSDWVNLQRAYRRSTGQPEESGTRFAPYADYEEYHKQAVKDALAKGEEVDDRVLADYPDLQPAPSQAPASAKGKAARTDDQRPRLSRKKRQDNIEPALPSPNDSGAQFSFRDNPQTDTPEFKRWFGDSKVVDADGKPLVVYHGTAGVFSEFDTKRLGVNTKAKSARQGFFFVNNPYVASGYALSADTQLTPEQRATAEQSYNAYKATERALASASDALLSYGKQVGKPYIYSESSAVDDTHRELYRKYSAALRSNADARQRFMAAMGPKTGGGKLDIGGGFTVHFKDGFSVNASVVPVFLSLQNPLVHDFKGQSYRETSYAELIQRAKANGNDGVILRNTHDSMVPAPPHDVYVAFSPEQIKSATGNSGTFDPTNPDIRFSFRTHLQGQNFTLSESNALDLIRTKVQDEFHPIKLLQRDLPTGPDVYGDIERMVGKAAYRMRRIETDYINPIVETMRKANLSQADVDEYLYALHAEERNREMAKLNRGQQGLSGMSDADAQAIKARWANNAAMKEVARMVRQLNDKTLDGMVADGLISQADADQWRATYQNYVPLRTNIEDDIGQGFRPGRGFQIRGRESRRALGRTSEADSPLIWSILQANEKAVRGEKNKVGQALLELVEANPDPDLWSVDSIPQVRQLRNGTVTFVDDPQFKNRDDVIVVKRNGEEHVIQFHGEQGKRIATAMKRLNTTDGGVLVKALQTPMKWYRASLTSYNPAFIVPNFIRDFQMALAGVGAHHGKAATKQFVIGLPKSAKALWDIQNGLDAGRGEEYHDYAREWMEHGGQITSYAMDGFEDISRSLNKLLTNGKPTTLARARAALKITAGFVDRVSAAGESATRLSAYVAARKAGASPEKAASFAKNLTVNFNRKGEWGNTFNTLYMFANASLQGTVAVAKLVTTTKVGRGIGIGLAMAGAAEALIMPALLGKDDEGRDIWDTIPEKVKETNWILPGIGKDRYIKIPMPYGLNVLTNAGRVVTELATGRKSVGDAAVSVTMSFVDAFNPLGDSGTLAQAIAPTPLDPFVQWWENKDWKGMPIIPEQPAFGPEKPDSELAFRNQNPVAVAVAKWINRVTGGDEVTSGAVDVAPGTLEHFVSWAFGGFGRLATQTLDTVTSDEIKPEAMPIVSRFVGRRPAGINNRELRDILRRGEDAWSDLQHYEKTGQVEKADRLRKERAKDLQFRVYAEGIARQMRDKPDEADSLVSAFIRDYRSGHIPEHWQKYAEYLDLNRKWRRFSEAKSGLVNRTMPRADAIRQMRESRLTPRERARLRILRRYIQRHRLEEKRAAVDF